MPAQRGWRNFPLALFAALPLAAFLSRPAAFGHVLPHRFAQICAPNPPARAPLRSLDEATFVVGAQISAAGHLRDLSRRYVAFVYSPCAANDVDVKHLGFNTGHLSAPVAARSLQKAMRRRILLLH
jgi:hypothetical protein